MTSEIASANSKFEAFKVEVKGEFDFVYSDINQLLKKS